MAQVKFHKFVAALPAELEADAIYYVRAGAGFDIYVTNSSGVVVAYPLNVGGPGQGFFRAEPITATASGQTTFVVPGGYTPGAIIVSLNGATLPPADYTATDGATVTLGSGAGIVVGSVLLVYVLSAFEVADALPIGGTAADSSKLGGTPEAEFYKRANILGTVSQSGGVPTGAIIERGSNANGEYVRFADGTQICTRAVTTGATSTPVVASWAASFAGDYQVVSSASGAGANTISVKWVTKTTMSASLVGTTVSSNGNLVFIVAQADIIAIGRWY